MLPGYRRDKSCGNDCKPKPCGGGFWRFRRQRALIGIACILLGILILLICAPEWLVALMIACLLFAIGCWCFGGRF